MQLGVTLASLGIGALGEQALARALDPVLATVLAVAIAFLIITYLHVVVGELVPKAAALRYSERIALGVIEETADKTQICFIGKKLFLVIPLAKDELGFLSIFVRRNGYCVTFIREHLRRDLCARIEGCRVNEIWRLVLNSLS